MFELRWRGRDTGEGEILAELPEHVCKLTFSEVGTKLEGMFEYPTPGGLFPFTGTKVAHGRGQKLPRSSEWTALSEDAWEREMC